MSPTTKRSSISTIGVLLALCGPLIITVILDSQSIVQPNTASLLGLFLVWVLSGIILFIVVRVESYPLASIGIKSLPRKEVALAVVMGVVLSLAVPLLTLLASQFMPSSQEGSIVSTTEATPVLLLLFGIFIDLPLVVMAFVSTLN
jgi:hypothetical protein